MKAAPYCPETLNRIRIGAAAHDLGWDEYFYTTVCRKHGIEPMPATAPVKAVEKSADLPAAPAPPLQPIKQPVKRSHSKRVPGSREHLTSPAWSMTRTQAECIRALSEIESVGLSEIYRRVIEAGLEYLEIKRRRAEP